MLIKLSDAVNLRPQQRPLFGAYFNDKTKLFLHLAHRRFGKGLGIFMLTMCAMIWRRGIYGYFLPTIGQSRKVIWETIGEDGIKLVDRFNNNLIANINHSEQRIDTVNGSSLYVGGSDNYKRYVGMNFCHVVYDEYQDSNPSAVHAFRPMITRNKGVQIFLGTPRAYNHVGEMYHEYKDNPDWYVTNLTIKDTVDEFGQPIITEKDVELERRNGMPEELIQQEYYGSFDATIRGAYFSEGLQLARKEGRIGNFPVDPLYPVYTGWDLGYDDSTAFWIAQVHHGKIFLIDYFEDRGRGMEYYLQKLRDRTDKFCLRRSIDFAPHDIEVHELGPGKSRLQQAREMGVIFRRVERPARKIHGIHCIRHMFSRFHFNEPKVKLGLKHLSEYRPDYDEKKNVYSLDPMRNSATHGADALQTFCLGWMKSFELENYNRQIKYANLYGEMRY